MCIRDRIQEAEKEIAAFLEEYKLASANGSMIKEAVSYTHLDVYKRQVPAHLEMLEDHYAHQVADMQRVGRGVDAQVGLSLIHICVFPSAVAACNAGMTSLRNRRKCSSVLGCGSAIASSS